jgi:hypothetical protein
MIKGIVCQVKERNIEIEECLKCSMDYENCPCEYTYPILASMLKDIEERKGITITMLTKCPRQIYIEKNNEIYIEIPYFVNRGKAFHSLVEKYKLENAIVEQRYSMEIENITISGQVDELIRDTKDGKYILIDYKTVRDAPKTTLIIQEGIKQYIKKPYLNHQYQMNFYKFLLAANEIEVKKIFVIYFTTERVYKVECPMWDLETIRTLLLQKLNIYIPVVFENQLIPKENTERIMELCPECRYWCEYCGGTTKRICDELTKKELKEKIKQEVINEIKMKGSEENVY